MMRIAKSLAALKTSSGVEYNLSFEAPVLSTPSWPLSIREDLPKKKHALIGPELARIYQSF
jgi:hypothetical protein